MKSKQPFVRALSLLCLGSLVSVSTLAQMRIQVPVSATAHQVKTTPIDLGNVPLGVAFPRTLTFTNTGSDATTVSQIQLAGQGIAVSNDTCTGSTVAAGASCSFTAAATVTAPGPFSASLYLRHSTLTQPDVYNFTATGNADSVVLTLAPLPLTFGEVSVNESSPPQTLTLTNAGTDSVELADIRFLEFGSHFTLDGSGCAGELAPGAECTLTVSFSPLSVVNGTARLVAEKADGETVLLTTVALAGVRGTPSFSTSQLTFNNAVPGVVSAAQAVTLTNTGKGKLGITSLTTTGDAAFTLSGNTCGTNLAAGASCTLAVTVNPPDATIRTGYLKLQATNTSTPSSSVQLYVSPMQVRPVLTLLPTSMSFPDTAMGQYADMTLKLQSTGNSPVNVTGFTLGGSNANQFSIVNAGTCTGALPAGEECDLTVRFSPTAPSAQNGTLTATHNSSETVPTVLLSGNGLAGDLTASPSSLNFGQVTVGSSATRIVVLANSGQAPVTIGTFTFSGSHSGMYSASGCSGQTLNPGGLCTVTITHTPTVAGLTTAVFTVAHNGLSKTRNVNLTSDAQPLPAGVVSLGAFTCTNIYVGETSTCTATLSNTGTAPLSVSSITRSNTSFAAPTHNCGASLSPTTSCTVTVTFTGTTIGTFNTDVTATTSAGAQSQPAAVSVLPPTATLTITPHPSTTVGTPNTVSHIVRNTGSRGTVNFSGAPVLTGSGFTLVGHTCSASLAPGANCTITTSCSAAAQGSFTGSVSIGSNAGNLSGNISCDVGAAAAPGATLGPFSCTTAYTGETSTCTATLSNTGTAVLSVGATTRTGSVFTAPTHNCGANLAPGSSCTVSTTYTSMTPGSATTDVTIATGAGSRTGTATANILAGSATLTTVPHAATTVGTANTSVHTVRNTGVRGAVSFSGAPTLTGSGFNLVGHTCNSTLAPGATCTITTSCLAAGQGTFTGNLGIGSNAGNLTGTVSCAVGAPPAPGAALGPFSCTTAYAGEVSTCSATLSNTGTTALTVGTVTRSGTAFTTPTHNCGASLAAGASCTVTTTYTSMSPGPANTTVTAPTGAGPQTGVATATILSPSATLTTTPHAATTIGAANNAVHTVRNTGTRGIVNFSGAPSLTGTGFSLVSHTCSSTLAPGATCTVTTRCTAATGGTFTGTANIGSNAGNLSDVLTCSVAAPAAPYATLSPFSCTSAFVGETATCTATLSNTGTAALTVSSVTRTNTAFTAPTHNCGASLAAGSSCTVTTTYSSTSTAVATTNVTVNSNGGNRTEPISLSLQGPTAVLSTVPHASTSVGAPNNAVHTVTNTGTRGTVTFSGAPTVSGTGFSLVSHTCTASLAPGATCTITTRCAATAQGAFTGTANINSSAGALSGALNCSVGGAAAAVATLGQFSCNTVYLGNPTTCTATLSNTGNAPLATTAVPTRTGTLFAAPTHNCGASLAAGASCTVTMTQTFTTPGTKTTTVTWALPGGTQTRPVTAQVDGPSATFTAPTPITTQVSVPITVDGTLTNTGAGPMTVSTMTVTGTGWTKVSQTCGTTLAQGASCTVTARCTPTAVGTRNGTLTANTGAGALTASVACVAQAASVIVTNPYPGLTTDVGSGSQSGNWRRLTNTGIGPVTLNTFVPGKDSNTTNPLITFTYDTANASHCAPGKVLTAGQSCDIFETYTRVNPTGTPLTFSNVASSISSSAGALTWASNFTVHGLGVTNATTATAVQRGATAQVAIRVTNGSPYAVSSATFTPTGMTGATGCGASLAAGASCTMTGTVTGPASGTSMSFGLSVNGVFPRVINGVVNAPQAASSLLGSGTFSLPVAAPAVTLVTTSHAAVVVGGSNTATHTLTNTGVGPVTLTSASLSTAAGLTLTGSTCGTVLEPGQSCTGTTTFAPTAAGTVSATLTVVTGAGTKTGPISATAMTNTPIDVNNLDFGNVTVGVASAPKTLVVSNGSPNSLTLSGLVLPAGVTRPAATSGDCAAGNFTLAAWRTCNLRLVWTPTALGPWSGTMTFNSNHALTPSKSVLLTGTGMPKSADMRVTINAASPVATSGSGSFTITVANVTSASAPEADKTPPVAGGSLSLSAGGASVTQTGLSCTSTSGTGVNCSNAGAIVLPPGTSATFTVTYTTGTSVGNFTVTAGVSLVPGSTAVDPVPGNNQATVTVRVEDIPREKVCMFTSSQVGQFLGWNPSGDNGGGSGVTGSYFQASAWLFPQLFDGWQTKSVYNNGMARNVDLQYLADANARWKGTGYPVTYVVRGSNAYKALPQVQVWDGSKWTGHYTNTYGSTTAAAMLGYCGTDANTPCSGGYYPSQRGPVYPMGNGSGYVWRFTPRYNASFTEVIGAQPYINYRSEGVGTDGKQYRQVWVEKTPGTQCAAPGTTLVPPPHGITVLP